MTSGGGITTTAFVQNHHTEWAGDGHVTDMCTAKAHAKSCRLRPRIDRDQPPERCTELGDERVPNVDQRDRLSRPGPEVHGNEPTVRGDRRSGLAGMTCETLERHGAAVFPCG